MFPIEKPIIEALLYRKRSDLASALKNAFYDLNESSTFGSRLFSKLTTVEIYVSLINYEYLQNLSEDDKDEIVKAFHVMYPVKDHDIELHKVFFHVDPDIQTTQRQCTRIHEIDFDYIKEQISKCDERISIKDYEGSVTVARNLIESLCKYFLDYFNEEYNNKDDLPGLYRKISDHLNMHPSKYAENSLKEILSGCFKVIQGLSSVRNEISDSHGKSAKSYYKLSERHAVFVTGIAKCIADFLYASFKDQERKGSF
jgi:hypothetical protein